VELLQEVVAVLYPTRKQQQQKQQLLTRYFTQEGKGCRAYFLGWVFFLRTEKKISNFDPGYPDLTTTECHELGHPYINKLATMYCWLSIVVNT
jgi:hypothetical protein